MLAKLSQGNAKHKSVTKLAMVVKVFIIFPNILECSRKDIRMCHENYGNGLLPMLKTPIYKETERYGQKFKENNNWRCAIEDIIQLMKIMPFPSKKICRNLWYLYLNTGFCSAMLDHCLKYLTTLAY